MNPLILLDIKWHKLKNVQMNVNLCNSRFVLSNQSAFLRVDLLRLSESYFRDRHPCPQFKYFPFNQTSKPVEF